MLFLSLLFSLTALALAALFTYECVREGQRRATRVGATATAVSAILCLLVLGAPEIRLPVGVASFLGLLVLYLLFRPEESKGVALQGTAGYLAGDDFTRTDERDIVFARNRSLRPGSEEYATYYGKLHPEHQEGDDRRRAVGGPLGTLGSIDGWAPNSAMVLSMVKLPALLAPHAETPAAASPEHLSAEKASEIVKGFALHLGAAAVGICKADPRWAYSHRGEIHLENWADWGKEIEPDLPYAVVVATEMDYGMVRAGPHTPAVVESMTNYALGAYITTILAQWFSTMGYRGDANHSRHYNYNLVPLAIDAGLGELGRFGYLISDQVGARCRLFACLTDMPLVPDKPVDLGVEAFCADCMKCADSCPSRSIPKGPKTVDGGLLRWKLNAETCFDYWGKVGTDCSICMGVCPFSRPNRSLHKLARWALKNSPRAQRIFPHLDNWIYGRRWKPGRAHPWVDVPKRGSTTPTGT